MSCLFSLRFLHEIRKNGWLSTIDAIVILPDHLHAIWQLPENDADFATRWRLEAF